MKFFYTRIVLVFIIVFYCFLPCSVYANNISIKKASNKSKSAYLLSRNNKISKSPAHINGIVFPITLNVATLPNLKVNQTAGYVFSYLVTNTKNVVANSYVWVDFDNNGVYTADEVIVTTIPANAIDFVVNISYANASFINKLQIGTLNIKFTTTTSTLVDDALTLNVDERSTSLGIDGETETNSAKNIAGIVITGSVFADGNGTGDGVIFGTGVGIIDAIPVNAYLLDNTNTIVSKSVFTPGGSYRFENLYNGTYAIAVSMNNYPNGTALAAIVPNFPLGWNLAGESFGSVGNLPLGIEPGVPNMQITVIPQLAAGGTDVFGVNFAVNRTPIATNDEVSTPINTPIVDCNLILNDTDPDGNLSINKPSILLIDPSDGLKKKVVVLPGIGTYTVNGLGEVGFVPITNFIGVAPTISYTVKDNAGIESSVATIKLVVRPVGVPDIRVIDAPVPSLTLNILANDGISGVLAGPAQTFENPKDATVVTNVNGDITFVFPPNQIIPKTYTYTYVLESGDGVSSDPITVTIVVAFSPAITLTKTGVFDDISGDGLAQAGETITYGFQVTNTGNVDVVDVKVSDPKINLSNAEILPTPLKPGETGFLTIIPNKYTITPADITAGRVLNTATATGLEPITDKIVNSSSDAIVIFPILKIALKKSSTIIHVNKTNPITFAGDSIQYTFIVKNTGTVDVKDVKVKDTNIGLDSLLVLPTPLKPGDSVFLIPILSKYKTIITQNDINTGFVSNTAVADGKNLQNTPAVTATSTDGKPISDPRCPQNNCTITDIIQAPKIALVKTAKFRNVTGDNTAQFSDIIDYTFTVTNTGNVDVKDIGITDGFKLNLVDAKITPSTLAPGAIGVLSNASTAYVITQLDIDAGRITNTAEAKGLDPNNKEVNDISGTSSTNDIPTVYEFATITLVKSSKVIDLNNNGVDDAGDRIDYTFTVTNTGSVILTNIVVSDLTPGITVLGGPIASLIPNQVDNTTFKASYIITQADVNKGFVSNTAEAIGKDPANKDVTATSTDGKPTSDSRCPQNNCTITEIKKGAKIALEKTAQFIDTNNDGFVQVGETIRYTFTVTNVGNVDVKDLTITDIMLSNSNPTVPIVPNILPLPALLKPNEVLTYTANYPITQLNIDSGRVENTATATAKDPNNIDVIDVSGTTKTNNDVTIFKFASLSLVKTSNITDVNTNGVTDEGDIINYVFTVKNTGAVTLTNIKVADLSANITGGPIASLAPNQVDNTTFTASHIITQTDVNTGFVSNTAEAIGKDPANKDVKATSTDGTGTSDSRCPQNNCTITEIIKAIITLTKTSTIIDVNNNGLNDVGDRVEYTFKVENKGNVPITNIVITDPKVGVTVIGGPIASLAPNASDNTTIKATYIITQVDADNGFISNIATAKGKTPNGVDVNATSTDGTGVINPICGNCTVTPVVAVGKIALTKQVTNIGSGSGANGTFLVGDVLNYSFTITNTGNLTLTSVVLTDPLFTVPNIPLLVTTLLSGASTTATGNYTITAADVTAGQVTNQATVTSLDTKNPKNVVTDKSGSANGTDDQTITQLAKPPFATPDTVTLKQNTTLPIKVLSNDVGVSSALDSTSVEIVAAPANGTLFINATNGTISYTPNAGYVGKDLLTYKVKDVNGKFSNTGIVIITVTPTVPVTVADEAKTEIAKEVIINILRNDKPDVSPLAINTIAIITQPKFGKVTINADSTVTYTPNPDYAGADEFTYNVRDANGNTSNPSVVKILVDGVFIPNVFTPNNDGINETFEIVGLANFSSVEIDIYNRWGNQVYKNLNYKNDWIADGLNEGTYYYIINLKTTTTNKTLKGWILIKR